MNPQSRLHSISTGSGLCIVKTYVTPPLTSYSDLEIYLHNVFAKYRCIGEWFSVSFNQVINCISGIDLNQYDKSTLFSNYVKMSKYIVTKKRIRDKVFTTAEKKLLFSIFMYHKINSKVISNQNNKPMNQKELCESLGCTKQYMVSTMKSLIDKGILKKVSDSTKVYYKFS